eukprot:TRINITY_DN2659_c0_g1_i2.p1 TRINITY_DN2659_c0_g1~~TRINITY_DN2659_c0_g1_i2.p1  ORF type:complete len:388 (+),score=65.05 TRINITY_DN2659_c0_g1_i2:243-1406(+)
MRTALLIGLTLVACGGCHSSSQSNLSARLTDALSPIMQQKSAQWKESAIGLTLYSPNRNLTLNLAVGVSDRATGAAPTPNTRYLFGSATKMFTATDVLRLVEQGALQLTQTVLPLVDKSLAILNQTSMLALGFDPAVKDMTIDQLLSMRSGLYDLPEQLRDWQTAAPTHDFGPVELLSLTNKKLACTPGSCGVYSDVNYILLGLILMGAQNRTTWEAVHQNSSIPTDLNMSSTEFVKHGVLGSFAHASNGYQPDGTDVMGLSAAGGWTCGNLLSNTHDLAKFIYALYGDGQCQVVQCNTVASMLWFQVLSPYFPVWYGKGTMAIDKDFWGHGGATYGFYSLSGYNPYLDFSYVLVTNLSLIHISEPTRLLSISYAVFCLKKKKKKNQ